MLDNENEAVVQPEGEEATSPVAEPQGVQETETPTPKEGETQEPEQEEERYGYDDPRHPLHPQWRTLQDEKHWVRQQQEKVLSQPQQQPQAIQDEYAQYDADTARWLQFQDKRNEKKFKDMLNKEKEPLVKTIQGQQQFMGQLLLKELHRDHPDLKKGSPEEAEVLQRIARGYVPDDAYKAVMFDKQGQTAQTKARQTQQQRNQAKKQANVESTSTPAQSGLPKKQESLEQIASRLYDEEVAKGWE